MNGEYTLANNFMNGEYTLANNLIDGNAHSPTTYWIRMYTC